MGNSPSKTGNAEELVKTTLFERERNGITYRIPALVYLRHCHTFLAFAEKRTSPSDCDAKILVMRRGTLKEDGTVQVGPPGFCFSTLKFITIKHWSLNWTLESTLSIFLLILLQNSTEKYYCYSIYIYICMKNEGEQKCSIITVRELNLSPQQHHCYHKDSATDRFEPVCIQKQTAT